MSEETQSEGIAAGAKFVVVAGFIGDTIVDEVTGRRAVHNRGDVLTVGEEISASGTRVELHRNRIAIAEVDAVNAIRAQERASQGDDAAFAGEL